MTTRDLGHFADTREKPAHRNVIELPTQDDKAIALRRGDAGRPRRFSEGIERKPPPPANLRVGRYSDGIERSPRPLATRRVGSFADGIAHHPDASWERRVGSFADGYEWLSTRAQSR